MPSTSTLEKKPTAVAEKPAGGFTWRSKHAFATALVLFMIINCAVALTVTHETSNIRTAFNYNDLLGDPSKRKEAWAWWLARGYLRESPSPDVVVFGSSQMGAAQATADAAFTGKWVDVLVHRHIEVLENNLRKSLSQPLSVVSLAMPGSNISDNYVMTKALFAPGHSPKIVVATIAPRDFIDNTLPSAASTDQFKFFGKYVDLGALEGEAYTDPFARLDIITSRLPLRTLGTNLMKMFGKTAADEQPGAQQKSEKAAEVVASIATTAEDVGVQQWVVPPSIEVPWIDNTVEYQRRFKGPNMEQYDHQMKFMHAWMQQLSNSGTRVVVIGMPSMDMNRALLPEKFWTRFRSDMQSVTREYGASWVDLTDSKEFTKADFLDTVHLKATGGLKLFDIIAQKVQSAVVASSRTTQICPD